MEYLDQRGFNPLLNNESPRRAKKATSPCLVWLFCTRAPRIPGSTITTHDTITSSTFTKALPFPQFGSKCYICSNGLGDGIFKTDCQSWRTDSIGVSSTVCYQWWVLPICRCLRWCSYLLNVVNRIELSDIDDWTFRKPNARPATKTFSPLDKKELSDA